MNTKEQKKRDYRKHRFIIETTEQCKALLHNLYCMLREDDYLRADVTYEIVGSNGVVESKKKITADLLSKSHDDIFEIFEEDLFLVTDSGLKKDIGRIMKILRKKEGISQKEMGKILHLFNVNYFFPPATIIITESSLLS